MSEELPFKAEYAKTGRAGCKGCKLKIDQGSLRLAIMVQVSWLFLFKQLHLQRQKTCNFNENAKYLRKVVVI